MKSVLPILFSIIFSTTAPAAQMAGTGGDAMPKIKLSFENKTVIVAMENNDAVRQFLAMLPEKFEFIDFAGEEKITEFPRPLSLNNAPRGMVAGAGKMFIYAPWGNLGFFYRDHGTTLDKSLIPLGTVINGLEHLQTQKGGFSATIEQISD